MYDLSQPNHKPGTCCKCKGTGVYKWGASINGKMTNSGPCHSCRGTGEQTARQIVRNEVYNKYKIASIAREML
jgi:DnaJ-class molecular chaperone